MGSEMCIRDSSGLVFVGILSAMFASLSGLLLSYHFNLPSGPAIILVAGIIYGISIIFGPVGGLALRFIPRRQLET